MEGEQCMQPYMLSFAERRMPLCHKNTTELQRVHWKEPVFLFQVEKVFVLVNSKHYSKEYTLGCHD